MSALVRYGVVVNQMDKLILLWNDKYIVRKFPEKGSFDSTRD